ncbi:MAG: hypothetical protein BWY05_00896 [Euryarchaeota archaeon ADurb.Bin165]|nr:MAG: hypothetical protein BWY05_00896 [Euryarchaeota archaeon ADurb.Bin165]
MSIGKTHIIQDYIRRDVLAGEFTIHDIMILTILKS